MVLATRIKTIRRRRENVRIDEIGSVMDIGKVYRTADEASDNVIKARFQTAYQVADDEEERGAITKLYMEWDAAERRESFAVHSTVTDAVNFLRENNEFWLGSFTPEDSGGAA